MKLIFLHIPKAAGSTFRSLLRRQYPGRTFADVSSRNGKDFLNQPSEVRDRYDVLRGHCFYGIHEGLSASAAYITFLRSPVDRIVSLYYHDKRAPSGNFHAQANRYSLHEFIERGFYYDELNNGQVRRLSGLSPGFGECTDEMLELAMQHIDKHFLAVGFVEYFDESVLHFAQELHWKLPPLYRVEKRNDLRPQVELPNSTIELIHQLNRLDVRLYESLLNASLPIFRSTGMRRKC